MCGYSLNINRVGLSNSRLHSRGEKLPMASATQDPIPFNEDLFPDDDRREVELRFRQRNEWPTITRTKGKTIILEPRHASTKRSNFWQKWFDINLPAFSYKREEASFEGPLALLYDVVQALSYELGNHPWMSTAALQYYELECRRLAGLKDVNSERTPSKDD